jgi:hypothetical protein
MVHTFLNARRRHYGTGLTPKHHNDRTNDPLNGQSLRGVFKKQYLASGAPANADRVMDAILYGRAMMPALGNTMTPQERTDLLAYMHTL